MPVSPPQSTSHSLKHTQHTSRSPFITSSFWTRTITVALKSNGIKSISQLKNTLQTESMKFSIFRIDNTSAYRHPEVYWFQCKLIKNATAFMWVCSTEGMWSHWSSNSALRELIRKPLHVGVICSTHRHVESQRSGCFHSSLHFIMHS